MVVGPVPIDAIHGLWNKKYILNYLKKLYYPKNDKLFVIIFV